MVKSLRHCIHQETGCDGEEDAGPLKEAVDSSNKGKFWDQKAADKGKASHRGQLPDYGKPRQCKDCNVNQWFSTVYCSEDSNTCCLVNAVIQN